MIGLTQQEIGKTPEALETFQALMDAPEATSDQRAVGAYQLGVCLETSDSSAALASLQRAKDLGCEVADLDARMAALSSNGASAEGFSGSAASKNIDYV